MIPIKDHDMILRTLLGKLRDTEGFCNTLAMHIADIGSGFTSLSGITMTFPDASVDAIVYPGDERKLKKIRALCADHDKDSEYFKNSKVVIAEMDVCNPVPFISMTHYNLAVCHLLFGEATKFGNTVERMRDAIMQLDWDYIILIDYADDPTAQIEDVIDYFVRSTSKKYSIIGKMSFTNYDYETYENTVGYLIEKIPQ